MAYMVIVGNAPLAFDYSPLVDSADVVVRLNDCKNDVGFSGTKTTILCVSNTGAPARRYIATASLRTIRQCASAREFWFPRHTEAHLDFVRRTQPASRLQEYFDLTDDIVRANGLEGRKLVRFSRELNTWLFRAIQETMVRHGIRDELFECPSTGMFAIAYALTAAEFRGSRLHLVGFGFHGWPGHPWAAERQLVADVADTGRLIFHPA
jgi:hypothetical protein